MLRERIVWIVALLLVAGLGLYSGQTIGVQAGEQNRTQATQQFFSQRGGQSGQGGGVTGTVSTVSGNTVTITTRAGQTVKVQLAAGATVRKQVDGQLSDITPGEQIVVFGAQNGDTLQATSIQIGGQAGGGRNRTPTPSQ